MTAIDLNADLGESFGPWRIGRDAEMLDIVTSANVACGFHAGDPAEMAATVAMCQKKRVGIGAHPGFDDLRGFGRRNITGTTDEQLRALVIYQIGALEGVAQAAGATVRHVKLHGALANMASIDRHMAEVLVGAIMEVAPDLTVMAMAATELQNAATALGARHVCEVFADRAYNDDGTLVARSQPGAVVHEADKAADAVLKMIDDQAVTSVNGVKVPVTPHSVCVHGDNPEAVALALTLRARLESAGIAVEPFAI